MSISTKNRQKLKRARRRRRRRKLVCVYLGPVFVCAGTNGKGLAREVKERSGVKNLLRSWPSLLEVKDWPGMFIRTDDVLIENWEKNYEANRKHIETSERMDYASWAEEPVFIIGAGPSLEKNAEHLAKVRNGRILALNGAIARAPKCDYFMSLDEKGDPAWFEGVDVTGIHGIFSYHCSPEVVERPWLKRTFTTNFLSYPLQERVKKDFPNMIQLDSGMHTGFAAFHFTFLMGANPIIFAGMDYSWEDAMHCVRHEHGETEESSGGLTQAQDINGQNVTTRFDYIKFVTYMRGAVGFLIPTGTRVINATEGGIFHLDKFLEQRKLKGIIKELNEARGN